MSDKQIHGKSDYRKYDAMTTEELEEILRADGSCTEESDTEALLYIMEVLAQRKRTSVTENKVQEAWDSFCEDYLPGEETVVPPAEKNDIKLHRPKWSRLVALAAVVVLVAGLVVTAGAVDWTNVWNVVAKWNDESFEWETPDEQEPTFYVTEEPNEFVQLIIDKTGRSDLVPTKIPVGFQLEEIATEQVSDYTIYMAYYSSADRSFEIRVQPQMENTALSVEKDDGPVEVYTRNGIDYYLMTNNNTQTAAWFNNYYECFIFGDLTKDEMKALIDTIP